VYDSTSILFNNQPEHLLKMDDLLQFQSSHDKNYVRVSMFDFWYDEISIHRNSDGYTPYAERRSAAPCALAAWLDCNGTERERKRVKSIRDEEPNWSVNIRD